MNSLTKVFFFLSLLSGQALWSQCEQVFVSGKVMDTMNVDMFYNLMVINKTSGRGVFGQPNGYFSIPIQHLHWMVYCNSVGTMCCKCANVNSGRCMMMPWFVRLNKYMSFVLCLSNGFQEKLQMIVFLQKITQQHALSQIEIHDICSIIVCFNEN